MSTQMKNQRIAERRLSVALMLVMLTTATAWAESTFGGGSGTISAPYLIYNTDQLDQLAADVNSGNEYEGVYFKLMGDLDYANKTYTPIGGALYDDGSGTGERKFLGQFLGNNYSINNVTINSEDPYCGLFGFLGYGGLVCDLTLGGNSSIVSIGKAGGIAGEVWNNANIINCQVGKNVVISVHPVAEGSAYRPGDFGGIAGFSSGIIRGCVSKATINNRLNNEPEHLGGIVGELGSQGKIEDCYFLGTVYGVLQVGDVVGSSIGGIIADNYYHTSFRRRGVDGSDTNGAKWMGTVSFGEHVSGSLPEATFEDGGTPYFGVGKAMVMSNMNYDAPAGYVATSVFYSANDVALVEDGANYRFTMPDEDVTLTGSATVKRDIGYSSWVTINIPNQVYSGHALTPVITVTDNMTGTPVTLEEGTDYTVTLPDGGCTDLGDYTIIITGIGDFGGQTTAVFSIVYPGSGTEKDPYIILTTDDLDGLAASVNGGDVMSGKHFRLMANLDYSGKTYTPIGTVASRFQGTFDGYGHSISNVVINQPDQNYQALFAVIGTGGTVKNLVLGAGSSITGGYYVGGIAGLCSGTITGCTVSEGVTISGNQEVGGIAGRIVGTLSGCVNKASVSGTMYVGGIAGGCAESTINDNLNLGAVSGNNNGGIIAFKISNTTFSNNYYAGVCSVGGIVGSDVAGQAMRGWTVTADDGIEFQRMPNGDGKMTGYTYDGKTYLGAGETSKMNISRGYEFSGYTLTVSAGMLTAVEGEDEMYTLTMPSTGQNVNISLTGDLTLDLLDDDNNASRISDNAGFTGSVCLAGRTLYKDGKWNTICLPFDVTIADSPLDGDGVDVRTLSTSGFSGGTLTLTFTDEGDVTTIEAGKPYIIRWEKPDGYTVDGSFDITNPVFRGVTISSTTAATTTEGSVWVDFCGTYSPEVIYESGDEKHNLYLGSDNMLYYPTTEDFYIGSCRGWFVLKNGLTCGTPAAYVRAFSLCFGDSSEQTGILSTTNYTNSDAWFTIDGRKLDGKPAKKGLYFHGGSKVVIK